MCVSAGHPLASDQEKFVFDRMQQLFVEPSDLRKDMKSDDHRTQMIWFFPGVSSVLLKLLCHGGQRIVANVIKCSHRFH